MCWINLCTGNLLSTNWFFRSQFFTNAFCIRAFSFYKKWYICSKFHTNFPLVFCTCVLPSVAHLSYSLHNCMLASHRVLYSLQLVFDIVCVCFTFVFQGLTVCLIVCLTVCLTVCLIPCLTRWSKKSSDIQSREACICVVFEWISRVLQCIWLVSVLKVRVQRIFWSNLPIA